jgi:hypothetical protein
MLVEYYGDHGQLQTANASDRPYVPPSSAGCCSVRCTQYLEVARQPVLGNPVFCQRDEPIKCWGCEVSFTSRGIRYCPECYFKARAEIYAPDRTPTPVRHDEPIVDRDPRSRCIW